MSALSTEPELLDALARGTPVVLPNGRSARALRQAFDARQHLSGATLWDAAPALSWTDWTRSLWSGLIADGVELRVLLNPAQEHLLWREVIESSPTLQPLTSPDTLADMARSAWSLAAKHRAIPRLRATASTYDSRTFAAWAEAFARLCATQACLPAALLEHALAEHARSGALRLDTPILLAGFLEPTPAQRVLLDALRSAGAEITEATLVPSASPATLRACTTLPSPREEFLFAARWLRGFLESHRNDPHPPRVALLLPELDKHRAELDSILREVLAPELESVHADPSSAPWEFASGTPLLRQPLVADALDLIRWSQGPLPVERISALLRSPFLGHTADLLSACRFDVHVLRRKPPLQPELTISHLVKFAKRHESSAHSLPSWLPALDRFLRNHPSEPTNTFAASAEFFRALLKAANFPGDRQPAPLDFEALRAWDSVLDLLATLDIRGLRTTQREASRTFERLLQATAVHVAGTHAPIQIMRPAEAEGSLFHAVVLLQATADLWPEPQRLNPLLGWPLQHALGLPGATATRDTARSRFRAESLLASTTYALVTNASHDGSGPLRSSPLIRQLGLQPVLPEHLVPPAAPPHPIAEELAPDDRLLPPLPSTQVHGGARVLQLQAACAFRAFAELRLCSSSPESPELGFDARERGTIMHQALESFWAGVHSQAELKGLTPGERDQRLREAVDVAFARYRSSTEWSKEYLALQRERLRRLLDQWLEFELKRGPFTIVNQEQKRPILIGPLQLELRPDRIDEVEGGHVLVDYKTGKAHSSAWEGDRPDDPQLPLYALLSEAGALKGLLFGRLRPGKDMGWHGLVSDPTVLSTLRRNSLTDLDEQIDSWRPILTALAQNFAEGRTEVAPKDYTHNCKYCGQRLLCRLDPATLLEAQLREPEEQETDA